MAFSKMKPAKVQRLPKRKIDAPAPDVSVEISLLSTKLDNLKTAVDQLVGGI